MQFVLQQGKKYMFIDAGKKRADIKLQKKAVLFWFLVAFNINPLKTLSPPRGTLITPASIRIMNKAGFPDLLKLPDHQMMHDPVSKIGGKNFPQFGCSW